MAARLSLGQRVGPWLRSVRLRLTLWSLILLAAVLLAFSLFVYVSQHRSVQANTSAELQDEAAQVASYIKNNHERLAQTGTAGLADVLAQHQLKPSSSLIVALLNGQGHISQMSSNLSADDGATLEKLWFTGQVNAKNPQIELSLQLSGPGADQAYEVQILPAPFPEFDIAAI